MDEAVHQAKKEARAVPEAFVQALRELGLAATGEPLTGTVLTGGVSSDIWCIHTARGPVAAKRALAKLRVAADWHAPIERNQYEARWMQVADAAAPGAAPRVLGQHAALGVLVMEYLHPADHALWKTQLRAGLAELNTASSVGATLVRIHAHAAARAAVLAPQFATDGIFFEIRLAPYLLATAQKHPALEGALRALVAQTQGHRLSLVHGDVSPKNILVPQAASALAHLGSAALSGTNAVEVHTAGRGPVLLDAECAWWGDPAFDLAFCLNHLLLKCLWTPAATPTFLSCFAALTAAYVDGITWEAPEALEGRAAALLPGLLLARVDGKSPVEYLTEPHQHATVRRVAPALLRQPVPRLADVAAAWQAQLPASPNRAA